MLRATRTQARATWLGAGVALIALAVSWFAWSGQQDMNRQQRELNEYLILREQRVYASGVVMWAEHGDQVNSVLTPGMDVTLQNRAPVPIRDVRIHASLRAGEPAALAEGDAELGDIAPCQTLRFRLSPPGGMDFADRPGRTGPWMSFSETDRQWTLDGSRLTLATGDRAATSPVKLLIPRSMTREPLDGCDGSG